MTRSVVYGPSVLLDAGGNKWTNLADGVAASDAATVGQIGGGGAVSSVFGRTGAVVAVTGDYYGAVAAALTGATQASRYVGSTASGAPASGTFVKGDWVVAQDGAIFVCTTGGTPGTWTQVGSAASFATPSVALASTAAAGAASTVIRSDSTIAAFDATSPTTQAFGDSAAVGTAAFAARRDHKHTMPATPVTSFAKSGGSALTGAVTISEGSGVTLTPSGNDIAIAASGTGTPTDGWVTTAVSLTYSSADSPTFVATTGSDLSGTIPVGARVKLTQTTVKYFIVTAIDATTITLYGGTDYTLANAAISAVSWSIMKVPAGFNPNPTKWTVEVTDTAQRTQANSTSTTWYNLGSVQIVIPIGCWLVQYECTVGFQRNTSAGVDLRASLSTANNSASDASMSSYSFMSAVTFFEGCLYRERILALAAKTTYYLVEAQFSTSTTPNTLFLEGSIATTVIRAVCAYL